ncbi:MAG: pilus assembly protein N-terminal domain-containing protein, partial [Nevskiales bacterium]
MKAWAGERGVVVSHDQQQLQQRETMMRLPNSVGFMLKAGLLAFTVAVLGAPLTAGAQSAAPASVTEPTALTVDVGTQQLLRQKLPIRRVAVANPEIADVSVINSRELLINGKVTGVTSLIIWSRDAKAQPSTYKVSVSSRSISGSTTDLLTHRDAVLASGGQSPGAATGSSGGGSAPQQAVADHTTVAVDSQVVSQVKIVDISRTALQEFGINFAHANGTGVIGAFTPGGVSGAQNFGSNQYASAGTPSVTSAVGFLPVASAFNFLYASNSYLGAISVLENKGLARTLAEPSLTAMSGQTASFLAGGEFPFPTVQNGGSGTNSITIIFKEFGIRLNLTPTVL